MFDRFCSQSQLAGHLFGTESFREVPDDLLFPRGKGPVFAAEISKPETRGTLAFVSRPGQTTFSLLIPVTP